MFVHPSNFVHFVNLFSEYHIFLILSTQKSSRFQTAFRPSKKLAFGDLFRRRMHRLPTRLTARRAANGVRKALLRKASEADAH
ncbi:MAG: hypothetical protein IKU70_00420, partial [Clostridia bacterium]|nr:hypothetical protein [Clostridia bacterium]